MHALFPTYFVSYMCCLWNTKDETMHCTCSLRNILSKQKIWNNAYIVCWPCCWLKDLIILQCSILCRCYVWSPLLVCCSDRWYGIIFAWSSGLCSSRYIRAWAVIEFSDWSSSQLGVAQLMWGGVGVGEERFFVRQSFPFVSWLGSISARHVMCFSLLMHTVKHIL